MNKTNKMAIAARDKAQAMGWETRMKLDQSDVLDWATVVAWAPGSKQARYIRFVEEQESDKGWIAVDRYYEKLDNHNCYC